MLITGHKTKSSLYAYLGKEPTSDAIKASKAARALHVPLPVSGGGPRARWPSGNDGRGPEGRRYAGMNITQAPSRKKLGLDEETTTEPYPLHLKQTSKVDMEKVATIARRAGKEIFFKGLPYYNGDAFTGCETSRILKNNVWQEEDVARMVEHGRLEPIPLMGKYLPKEGYHAASIFTVEEKENKRRRIITEPRLNGCMGDTVPKIRLPHRLEKRARFCSAGLLLSLDYAAFYDAFVLPREARNNFVIRINDRCYRLVTLATGGKWSVLVAETTTETLTEEALQDVPEHMVQSTCWIDNIILSSPEAGEQEIQAMLKAAEAFFDISREVGAPLNLIEVDGEKFSTEEVLQNFVKTVTPRTVEILGEEYTRATAEEGGGYFVQNSKKTLKKLEDVKAQMERQPDKHFSIRVHASRLSLCLYAAHTVGLNPALLQAVLEGSSTIGKYAEKLGWDEIISPEKAKVASTAVTNIINTLLHHPKTRAAQLAEMTYDDNAYDVIMMTDASKEGWGAIVTSTTSKEKWIVQRKWTKEEKSYCRHSAAAEPKGAEECIRWWLEKTSGKPGKVALVSDHHAIMNAQRNPKTGYGGVGYGLELNRLYQTANECTGVSAVHFFYVPGESNLADALSRNLPPEMDCTTKVRQTYWEALPPLSSFYNRFAVEEEGDLEDLDDDCGADGVP